MSLLRWLPKRLRQRIRDYAPRSFPDAGSCGAFYDARARLFRGDEAAILEYSSFDVQQRLFERAVDALPPHGRILDIGCGFGHLLDFIEAKGFAHQGYHGIDLSEAMIEASAARLAGRSDVSFESLDLMAEGIPEKSHEVAYIISVLGYPIGRDPMKSMMTMLGNVFRGCTDGLLFSHVMDGRRDRPLAFPTDPESLAAACERAFGARAEIHDDGVAFTYLMSLRHPADGTAVAPGGVKEE